MKNYIKKILSENKSIKISKNMESAKYFGGRFGQDVEPAGTYVVNGRNDNKGWVNGFANPKKTLFINVDNDTLIRYKYDLYEKYNKKGVALTNKLMKDGYDSIITVFPNGEYGEIILFPNCSFMMS